MEDNTARTVSILNLVLIMDLFSLDRSITGLHSPEVFITTNRWLKNPGEDGSVGSIAPFLRRAKISEVRALPFPDVGL